MDRYFCNDVPNVFLFRQRPDNRCLELDIRIKQYGSCYGIDVNKMGMLSFVFTSLSIDGVFCFGKSGHSQRIAFLVSEPLSAVVIMMCATQVREFDIYAMGIGSESRWKRWYWRV